MIYNVDSLKPFLRWAGGKIWLTRAIDDFLPKTINNYYEPFLGGGSIFIHLKKNQKITGNAYLSDINEALINTYKIIRDHPSELVINLKKHKNNKDYYYRERAIKYNQNIERASQFIYLNRTSFNGIYRENLKGEYNVPYGGKKYRHLFDLDNIMNLSSIFENCMFENHSFTQIKASPKEGDFVFLDPPYTVAHSNNGFIRYNQKIFSWEDQKRLKIFVHDLHLRNVKYILTNAFHKNIEDLYKNFSNLHTLTRPSSVGGRHAKRTNYKELLITNI